MRLYHAKVAGGGGTVHDICALWHAMHMHMLMVGKPKSR